MMIEFFDATTVDGARAALAAVVADDRPCCGDYQCRLRTAAQAIADAINGRTPMSVVARGAVDGDPKSAHRVMLSLVIDRWARRGVVPGEVEGRT